MPAGEVIASYHDLWHVEQSFRMSKTDLRARPMFHRTRDAIEAHLTIVFTALAVARDVQAPHRPGHRATSSRSCARCAQRPSPSTAPRRPSPRHQPRRPAILDALTAPRDSRTNELTQLRWTR